MTETLRIENLREICQYRLDDGSGLSWSDINWIHNSITLKGKRKERSVPIVKPLQDALVYEMQNRIQDGNYDIDDLVVHYISDTVTKMIKKALK